MVGLPSVQYAPCSTMLITLYPNGRLDTLSANMIKENAVELLTSIVSKGNEDESVVLIGTRAIATLVDSSELNPSNVYFNFYLHVQALLAKLMQIVFF